MPITTEVSQYSPYVLKYTTSFTFANDYNRIRVELPVLKITGGTNYN